MKKHLTMLAMLLLVVMVAAPVFAAVEFQYGGLMRLRYISNNNIIDASELTNDNQNFIDQRTRLYFTFKASENLKIVYKMEIGDIQWGLDNTTRVFNQGTGKAGNIGRTGVGTGGSPGADGINVKTKNAYMEFNIPNTMLTADVGVQTITLLDSWIIDDDFASAVLKANLDPFKVQVGYVAGQTSNIANDFDADNTWQDRVDSWYIAGEYKGGPFGGALVGYYQNGHNTSMSVDPSQMSTPFTVPVTSPNLPDPLITDDAVVTGNALTSLMYDYFGISQADTAAAYFKDNNLFDLGANLTYKQSWMSAYVNFVKNLGSTDLVIIPAEVGAPDPTVSIDYKGFMVDAGANFFCGPYTFNIGGFYTSGDERVLDEDRQHASLKNPDEINRFVYPASTQKYFSEIIGGGVLDNNSNIAHTKFDGKTKDYQWEGYGWPTNIWTVTVGAAWQVLEKTKVSASYWYFGTSEDVLGKADSNGNNKLANDIGHEIDLYVTQGIVDGLNLDLVGAYLFKGDAYSAAEKLDDAYELGARLQWNF